MCSWCWGFEPVKKDLFNRLEANIIIKRYVGGLAPDSNEPMSPQMRTMLENTWRKIETAVPGTKFNYDFWKYCQPRRSTYPSNRAVIAARLQDIKYDELITFRIQQAYYSQAKNPSDESVLIELASDIAMSSDFEIDRFIKDLRSDNVENLLQQEIQFTRQLGLNSFPSLAYQFKDKVYSIKLDYNNASNMLTQIEQINRLN